MVKGDINQNYLMKNIVSLETTFLLEIILEPLDSLLPFISQNCEKTILDFGSSFSNILQGNKSSKEFAPKMYFPNLHCCNTIFEFHTSLKGIFYTIFFS